jgi:putative transposase
VKARLSLVDRDHSLSLRRQSDLLQVHRSRIYYKPVGETPENLELMKTMDRLCLDDPTLGVVGMRDELDEHGQHYSPKRIRRLMRLMGYEPIYPKRNLSRLGQAKYVRPYLLRKLKIIRPNQVWAIDITYIPMQKGFMYLTAIIDLYSRYIVGWQISNTLEADAQTELLKQVVAKQGKPEIINSDQGSQYTSEKWVETVADLDIRISMNGKGRAADNTFIERWFRTLKQKHIYLNPANSGLELYEGVDKFVRKYNCRKHQGLNHKKPIDLFKNAA